MSGPYDPKGFPGLNNRLLKSQNTTEVHTWFQRWHEELLRAEKAEKELDTALTLLRQCRDWLTVPANNYSSAKMLLNAISSLLEANHDSP